MTLSEQLFFMMQKNGEAMQPTDLVTGTVTSVSPLEITSDTSMAPLRKEVLYLTESVVEKKIPILEHTHATGGLRHSHTTSVLSHSHTVGSSSTSSALGGSYPTSVEQDGEEFESSTALKKEEIVAVEHGKPLPVREGYIILNRGLELGDKVLLLRVQHGQKFIVLSRIFE